MIRLLLSLVVTAISLSACGGGDLAVAHQNPVFYDNSTIGGDLGSRFEVHYPPLDLAAKGALPSYRGVEVLDRNVRFSRPSNWLCLLYTSPSPETPEHLVCRLLLEKKNKKIKK